MVSLDMAILDAIDRRCVAVQGAEESKGLNRQDDPVTGPDVRHRAAGDTTSIR